MAAAAHVGCSFCLDFAYFQVRNEGLDEVKASEVPRWRESAVFTPLEREVMEYAEAMTETPRASPNTAMGISSQGFSKVCALPLAPRSVGHASSA